MNFIYHGEVKIPEDYLQSFMAVSGDLQIQSLLEAFVGEADKSLKNISTEKEKEDEKNNIAKSQKTIFAEKKLIGSTEKTSAKSHPPFYFVKAEIQDINAMKCEYV